MFTESASIVRYMQPCIALNELIDLSKMSNHFLLSMALAASPCEAILIIVTQ